MKKRQLGIMGIAIGQAISLLAKDKQVRDDVVQTPGLFSKIKKIAQGVWDMNKNTFASLRDTNREDIGKQLKSDADHDVKTVQTRVETHEKTDRHATGKEVVATGKKYVEDIKGTLGDQKALAETAEKYKTRLQKRWDGL